MPDGCPFCVYASGDAEPEGGFAWDDDVVMAFRPLHPFSPGHLLVCPRQHVESILDATPALGSAMLRVVQAIVAGMTPDGYTDQYGVNVLTAVGAPATQTVMHWHVHLVPRHVGDRLGGWPWKVPAPLPGAIQIHMQPSQQPPVVGYSRQHLREAWEAGRDGRPI